MENQIGRLQLFTTFREDGKQYWQNQGNIRRKS
jgi:hypothetical protein